MNILILGGLFALGIVAILAVVLLGRSEQRQPTARANGTGVQPPALVESHPTSVPELPAASPSQRLTVPLPGDDEGPLDGGNTLMGRDEQPYLSPRQGSSVQPIPALYHPPDARPQTVFQQFQEVADEIHALHQYAWDLEQRLGRLSDMVDHFERVQKGQTSVEEEPSLP